MNRPALAARAWIVSLGVAVGASCLYLFAPGLQGSGPLFNLISGSSAREGSRTSSQADDPICGGPADPRRTQSVSR